MRICSWNEVIGDQRRKESALMVSLSPGAYTAIVSGAGNSTGVAIVEVYKLGP